MNQLKIHGDGRVLVSELERMCISLHHLTEAYLSSCLQHPAQTWPSMHYPLLLFFL